MGFSPEERVNHQGWDESEEGPVNQNEWAPLRALVLTRPQRISQPPFGTWSAGCKERSRRSPAQSYRQTRLPLCRYSATSCLLVFPESCGQQGRLTNIEFLFYLTLISVFPKLLFQMYPHSAGVSEFIWQWTQIPLNRHHPSGSKYVHLKRFQTGCYLTLWAETRHFNHLFITLTDFNHIHHVKHLKHFSMTANYFTC